MSYLNRNALVGFSDLRGFVFGKDSTATADQMYVEQLINMATDRCSAYVGREFALHEITEYHDGRGRDDVFLMSSPLQSVISLWDDAERNFTSAFEIAVTTNVLLYEELGRLRLWNEEAGFAIASRNVKVRYRAGYDLADINGSEDDRIDFKVGTTSTLTATLAADRYESVQSLIGHIQTRLNAVATSTASLTVRYNWAGKRHTIENSTGTTFQLLWNGGSNSSRGAHWKLGFDGTSDKTGKTKYTGDHKVHYVPGDLKQSIAMQAAWWYKESKKGDGSFGESGRNIGGVSVQNALAANEILPQVKSIWDRYRFVGIPE